MARGKRLPNFHCFKSGFKCYNKADTLRIGGTLMKKIILLSGILVAIVMLALGGIGLLVQQDGLGIRAGGIQPRTPLPIFTANAAAHFTYTTTATSAEITGLHPDVNINNPGYNIYLDIPSQVIHDPLGANIPVPVRTIAGWAFPGASDEVRGNIIGVTLPDTIYSIGSQSFARNIIETLVLPSNVTVLAGLAFRDNNITHVTIPGTVTNFGVDMFMNNHITSVTLQEGLTFIPQQTFAQNRLTSVTIPSTVTTIGVGAFQGNQLASLTIPNNVATIQSSAFAGNNIETLAFPESIQTIGAGAFNNNDLTSVTFPALSALTRIYQLSFANNDLTSINLPSGITNIGYMAFANNSITGHLDIPHGVITIDHTAFSNNYIETVSFPNTLTTIGSYAFQTNELTSVTFPTSVTTIGASSFRMNNITNVTMTNNVTSLGAWAFWHNDLTSIQIPTSLTVLNDGVFADNNLATVIIPEGVTTINRYVFARNELISALLPSTVTYIGERAFMNNELASVNFQDATSLAIIGPDAFVNNEIGTVVLPSSIVEIRNWAFLNNNIASINFENATSLQLIGVDAFNRNQLTEVHIPSSVTEIRNNAFQINPITIFTIPNSVAILGNSIVTGTTATTIFTQFTEAPAGWLANWNPNNRTVIWGASPTPTIAVTNPGGTAIPAATLTWADSRTLTIHNPNRISEILINGQSLGTLTGGVTHATFSGYSATWVRGAYIIDDVRQDTITLTLSNIGRNLEIEVRFPTFDITTEINPDDVSGLGINVTGGATLTGLPQASTRELTASVITGWRFTHWTATGGSFNNDESTTTTFTLGEANTTITAHFQSYVTANNVRVDLTSAVTHLPHLQTPTPPTNHVFAGWALTGTTTVLPGTFELSAGDVFVPIFAGYVLRNGAQLVLSLTETYRISNLGTIANQPGRDFAGWRVIDGHAAVPSGTALIAGQSFVPVWQDFITVDGQRVNLTSTVYEVSHLTQAPTTPHHIFAGWALYGTTTILESDFEFTAGNVLIPIFHGFVTANGAQVLITATVSQVSHLTTPAIPPHHTFAGWSSDGTAILANNHQALTPGMTLTPIFHAFVTAYGTQVTLTPDVTHVSHLAPPTREGHTFTGWTLYGTAEQLAQDFTLVAGMVLVPLFNPEGGFPWLVVLLSSIGFFAVVGTAALVMVWRRKKPEENIIA